MARGSKNWVLVMQPKNGGSQPLQLEITPLKKDKVLEMIRRELTRKEVKESQRYTSVSLEPFFDYEDRVNDCHAKKVPSF